MPVVIDLNAVLMLIMVAAAVICWCMILMDKTAPLAARIASLVPALPVLLYYMFFELIPSIKSPLANEIGGGPALMLFMGLGYYLALCRKIGPVIARPTQDGVAHQ